MSETIETVKVKRGDDYAIINLSAMASDDELYDTQAPKQQKPRKPPVDGGNE